MSQIPPPPLNASATVPNYLVLAIIATVVSVMGCCLPHGLVSVYFSMQVNKKVAAGDIDGATNAAKQAKMWAWISIIVGALSIVLSFVFGVFAGIMSTLNR
jgi:membrane protein YqaA with SNARE-associated domain